jgi:hypothetical protein
VDDLEFFLLKGVLIQNFNAMELIKVLEKIKEFTFNVKRSHWRIANLYVNPSITEVERMREIDCKHINEWCIKLMKSLRTFMKLVKKIPEFVLLKCSKGQLPCIEAFSQHQPIESSSMLALAYTSSTSIQKTANPLPTTLYTYTPLVQTYPRNIISCTYYTLLYIHWSPILHPPPLNVHRWKDPFTSDVLIHSS